MHTHLCSCTSDAGTYQAARVWVTCNACGPLHDRPVTYKRAIIIVREHERGNTQ